MAEATHNADNADNADNAEITERLDVIDRRFDATDKCVQMEVFQITSRIDRLFRDLDARVAKLVDEAASLDDEDARLDDRLDDLDQGLKTLTARGTTERELRDTVARQREEIGFLLTRIDSARNEAQEASDRVRARYDEALDRHAAQFAEKLSAIRAGNAP